MTTKRILIIDDNEEIHNIVSFILGKGSSNIDKDLDEDEEELFGKNEEGSSDIPDDFPNLEIDSAYQGWEGFNMVKMALEEKRTYDLIICDMRMPPGWDGLKTMKEIIGLGWNNSIVLCSAYSDYNIENINNELEIEKEIQLLRKPFSKDNLRKFVVDSLKLGT